jgi:hypothetical protein
MTTRAEMSIYVHVAGTKLVKAIQSASRRGVNTIGKKVPPPAAILESGDFGPMGAVRIQHTAGLFADIVAFTLICENLEPARVIGCANATRAWATSFAGTLVKSTIT